MGTKNELLQTCKPHSHAMLLERGPDLWRYNILAARRCRQTAPATCFLRAIAFDSSWKSSEETRQVFKAARLNAPLTHTLVSIYRLLLSGGYSKR